jgi:hypothetical protein
LSKGDLATYAKEKGQLMLILNFVVLFGLSGIVIGMFVYRVWYLFKGSPTKQNISKKEN